MPRLLSSNGSTKKNSGVSLVEMMIAVAILSVATLGIVSSFKTVQRGIQMARDKTLASNLAQEKIQIIEQQSYPNVLPTQNPAFLPNGAPYDTNNFPPENILEGGVNFQRYTYIQVVMAKNGTLTPLPPTTPDTGMRQITITISWLESGQKKYLFLNSVMSNPNTVESNCTLTGTVTDAATGNPIPNATVDVAEDIGWNNSTNISGIYSIGLSPGSFNVAASAQGYFPSYIPQSVSADTTVTLNFSLTAISSGSVMGAAWINPNLLISQIVVSTPQANGYDVEYMELFNPTTGTLMINGNVNLNYVSGYNNTQCSNIPLNYVASSVGPGQYFLIANTTTFTVDGSSIAADAYYTDTANSSCVPGPYNWSAPFVRDILARGHSGTIWLTDAAGNTLDAVGWTNNGSTHNPSHCNETCIPQPSGGLAAGQQIVRTSSPAFVSALFGRAYSSANNAIDFAYPGNVNPSLNTTSIQYPPNDSLMAGTTVIAGIPAVGAVITSNDGLSTSTMAYSASNPPIAEFTLLNVATGTWSVVITSGVYEMENDTVTVPTSGSVYLFPSSTTILNQTPISGFIAGIVTDANGNPISIPSLIEISAAGSTAFANQSTGRYLLRLSSGIVDVSANPNSANPDYISISSAGISVFPGQIQDGVDFVLTQGGRLNGWVTRDGINGLQGIPMSVTDSDGNTQDQEISDPNGAFQTINLATGTYTVRIPLDSTETSNPNVVSATILSGQTVFVGTFTITGALGTISGTVTSAGSPISTGVLIVVTTDTLPSGPPTLSTASLTGISYYSTSSEENGTYSVEVRQSTSPAYNIYGYYPTLSPSGAVTISQQSLSNVSVLQGQTVPGNNLAW